MCLCKLDFFCCFLPQFVAKKEKKKLNKTKHRTQDIGDEMKEAKTQILLQLNFYVVDGVCCCCKQLGAKDLFYDELYTYLETQFSSSIYSTTVNFSDPKENINLCLFIFFYIFPFVLLHHHVLASFYLLMLFSRCVIYV